MLTHLELDFSDPFIWLLLIGGILIIGLLSGAYPAFYLSGFRPAQVLKAQINESRSSGAFRRALIVFQFTVAVVLIIGTLTVFRQVLFMKTRDLGFNQENLMYFKLKGSAYEHKDAIRQAALRNPAISDFICSSRPPGMTVWQEGWMIDDRTLNYTFLPIQPGYCKFMGLEMLEGKPFSWDHPSQKHHGYLINETAKQYFNLKDPAGKTYHFGEDTVEILGVVQNFHFKSLHTAIGPLVMSWDHRTNYANVRIKAGQEAKAIQDLREIWRKFENMYPFKYYFLDNTFEQLYKNDERLGTIFGYFAFLAIFIASLGLFGLSLYSTQQRTKEVGIRKANGASSFSIVRLFAWRFVRWVFIGNVIAWPVAGYIMQRWLQQFPNRIDLSLWIYIAALLLSLLIALLTVTYHTLRSASTNPACALRYE